jgi:3D (Asp-Asp-Asp) domain-containing protein
VIIATGATHAAEAAPPGTPRLASPELGTLPVVAGTPHVSHLPAASTGVEPQPVWETSRDGSDARALAPQQGRRLVVQLTAYSASEEEGTAWGITYTGVPARSGTVAVDPAVIALGSRLRIAGLPGIYRAEDTGGDIRGAHIDVFMASRTTALEFGRHLGVPVEVLSN